MTVNTPESVSRCGFEQYDGTGPVPEGVVMKPLDGRALAPSGCERDCHFFLGSDGKRAIGTCALREENQLAVLVGRKFVDPSSFAEA